MVMHYSPQCDSMYSFFLALCPIVLCKCLCIIYVFGVESSEESIGGINFAFGTFSGHDLFQFCSMFGGWFPEMWCAQEVDSLLWH